MMGNNASNKHRHRLRVLLMLIAGIGLFIAGIVFILRQPVNSPAVTTNPQPTDPLVRADLVVTGIDAPTAIVASGDRDDARLFVVERAGRVRIVSQQKTLSDKVFLDVSDKVLADGEQGLLGLAFHPRFSQNGFVYASYVDKDQNSTIARFKVSADPDVVDVTTEKTIFSLKQPYSNHNGGDLAFGPDGYLYIALGDGGSAGDPQNRSQDKTSYFGKILRIDINKGDPYSVPATNPFVSDPAAKAEIWSYGLRNPWRFSFDKSNGDMFIADVGQGKLEEVNFQSAKSKGGENYGWRCYEGRQPYNTEGCSDASSYVGPAFEYDHQQERCSITGGYVYHGTRFPELRGKYFYGDFCNGQLFYASRAGEVWEQKVAAETPYGISAFGQGNDGELYFADFKTGSMYHILDVAGQ